MQLPLSLDALRVLDTIDRRGSFAGAADELHRVTSAISYTVQKLEEDLDVALFDRSGHRARLTPAGRLVLERGRELLDSASQLAADARQLASGWEQQLSIALDAIYPEALLLPLVRRFLNNGGETDIRLASEVLTGPWDALESGRADIAIGSGQFRLPRPFRTRRLDTVQFISVAAPRHPIFEDPEPAQNLHRHRAVPLADTARSRATHSVRLGVHQPSLTVSHFSTKLAALEAGLGIGAMPEYLLRDALQAGRLRRIPLPEEPPIDMLLAWHPGQTGRAKQWFLRELPRCFTELRDAPGT